MTLRGYDNWKEPSEYHEAVEVRCKNELVFCGCTGEPTSLSDAHWDTEYQIITEGWAFCVECGKEEDLAVDRCDETWETTVNTNQALGSEFIKDEKCPRCGNDDHDKMQMGGI